MFKALVAYLSPYDRYSSIMYQLSQFTNSIGAIPKGKRIEPNKIATGHICKKSLPGYIARVKSHRNSSELLVLSHQDWLLFEYLS